MRRQPVRSISDVRAHLNGGFCTGEALGNACSVLGDDSLLLKVSHPGERVFEREVRLAVMMVEPELFVFQLRLRMVKIAIGSTFDAQIETRLQQHFCFPTQGSI